MAAAQVVAGFDADGFTDLVQGTSVGISIDADTIKSPQGDACADLLVRLCARLYPKLAVTLVGDKDEDAHAAVVQLERLASQINPNLEIVASADVVVHIGPVSSPSAVPEPATGASGETAPDDPQVRHLYVGSDDWTGSLSLAAPQTIGAGTLTVGAGIAACLAASALFRILLDPTAPRPNDASLCALTNAPEATTFTLPDRTALVGGGAVGQACLWMLARLPVMGDLHVVEPQVVDLGNVQRYVITDLDDVLAAKTSVARTHVEARSASLKIHEHQMAWADAADVRPAWDLVGVAVDSAEARRQVQASLPRVLVNAWTQAGDLGVSVHNFLNGACCSCLYLPRGTSRNEDEIVADALRVPDRLMDIRTLLYTGGPVPDDLLQTVVQRLGLDPSAGEAFTGSPIRQLYVDGICGGGLLPLVHAQRQADLHVPLAHQSALAGVLLAARMMQVAADDAPTNTEVTRVDVRRDPPDTPHQGLAKDPRGLCICQDDDYVSVYRRIWPQALR